jgi:hypothetical protein
MELEGPASIKTTHTATAAGSASTPSRCVIWLFQSGPFDLEDIIAARVCRNPSECELQGRVRERQHLGLIRLQKLERRFMDRQCEANNCYQ